MIDVESMNLTQVRQRGLEILSRELGPIGLVRFLQQFEMGKGNYTKERHQWLDEFTVDEIANQIQKKRTNH
jgi:hypothetical protein